MQANRMSKRQRIRAYQQFMRRIERAFEGMTSIDERARMRRIKIGVMSALTHAIHWFHNGYKLGHRVGIREALQRVRNFIAHGGDPFAYLFDAKSVDAVKRISEVGLQGFVHEQLRPGEKIKAVLNPGDLVLFEGWPDPKDNGLRLLMRHELAEAQPVSEAQLNALRIGEAMGPAPKAVGGLPKTI